MQYYSTNKQTPPASLEEAVVKGLAPDKGLYMPEKIKRLPPAFSIIWEKCLFGKFLLL